MNAEIVTREYVSRLARRIPANDPLRKLADSLLGAQPVRPEHLGAAIADVQEPRAARWRRLVVALWVLDKASAPADETGPLVRTLGRILDGEEPKDHGHQGAAWCVSAGLLGGAFGAFLLTLCWVDGENTGLHGWVARAVAVILSLSFGLAAISMAATLFMTPFFVPLSVWVDQQRLVSARALAARVLGRFAAPEGVGSLARAARCPNLRLRRPALSALRCTLDALTPECYGRVPALDQQHLLSLVGDVDESLGLAVLDGLGKVGGGAVAAGVRDIAGGVAGWRVGSNSIGNWLHVGSGSPAIREAAARVLPAIEERASKERDRGLLLRAAASAPEPALLRPAGSAAERPEVLLRPVGEDSANARRGE